MAQREGLPAPSGRRRGRPVGTTSAETRSRILRASRQVINERGYQAATFQAISSAAGLSRPTLHYYFTSREEIYRSLVAEASAVMSDCISTAKRRGTLVDQLSALIAAIHEADVRDRSQMAFLVSARLESTRNPELRAYAASTLREFLTTLVGEAAARGELAGDAAVAPVVEMLHAIMWGVGFYAGFIEDAADMHLITEHLEQLISHGLVGGAAASKAHADTALADTDGDTPSTVVGQP